MKKIEHFNEHQIKEIREIFPLICEEISRYSGKELCPKCKKHHKRMPDEETFKQLLNLFDATDQAWSEVFFTNRASVSKLRKKYSIGSYNLQEIWNGNRFWYEWEEGIDLKPIEDFFDLLLKFPRAKETKLMEIAEINKHYLSRIMRNNLEIEFKYNQIKSQRNSKNGYIFCIKCKIRKKDMYFKYIDKNKSKKSVICDFCNIDNKSKCTNCGEIWPESKLIKVENNMLQCKNCFNT